MNKILFNIAEHKSSGILNKNSLAANDIYFFATNQRRDEHLYGCNDAFEFQANSSIDSHHSMTLSSSIPLPLILFGGQQIIGCSDMHRWIRKRPDCFHDVQELSRSQITEDGLVNVENFSWTIVTVIDSRSDHAKSHKISKIVQNWTSDNFFCVPKLWKFLY